MMTRSVPKSTHDDQAGMKPMKLPRRERRRAAVEVGVVMLLMLAIVWRAWHWLPWEKAAREGIGVAAAIAVGLIVVLSFVLEPRRMRRLGLVIGTMRAGWRSVGVFSLLAVIAIIGGGLMMGHASEFVISGRWVATYLGALVAQQLLMQCFVNDRLHEVIRGNVRDRRTGVTVAATTAAYVALHAPNPALMIGTAIVGVFWAWHYRVCHNVMALMASHFAIGLSAMVCLGPNVMMDLTVGRPAWERLMGP